MKLTALDKINLFVRIYGRMFAAVFNFAPWAPFLILAFFQALGLFGLINFHLSGWSALISPLISRFISEEMIHYPQYYLALPSLYSSYSTFILGPTIWVILSAAAVHKLSGYHSGEKISLKEALRSSRRLYFPLLLFWIIETGIVLVVMLAPSVVLAQAAATSPLRKLVLNTGLNCAAFAVSAFFVYTIPGVIIGGKKIFSAIAGSAGLCARNFFLTFFIVAVPGSIGLVFDLILTEFSGRIVTLLNPELILLILYIRIAAGIFVNLFIYGAAVFVYKELE